MSFFDNFSTFLSGAIKGYQDMQPTILNALLYRLKVKDQKMRHEYMRSLIGRMNSNALENYLRNRFRSDTFPPTYSLPQSSPNYDKIIRMLMPNTSISNSFPNSQPDDQMFRSINNWLSSNQAI